MVSRHTIHEDADQADTSISMVGHCTLEVEGVTYGEMLHKAYTYAAKFFDRLPEELEMLYPAHAKVVSTAPYTADVLEPDLWRASFTLTLRQQDSAPV